jgi:hypothetical protein
MCFLYGSNCVFISQKTAFFTVTAKSLEFYAIMLDLTIIHISGYRKEKGSRPNLAI